MSEPFPETQAEQDKWYARKIKLVVDNSLGSDDPFLHRRALEVIRDYVWYIVKD